LRHATSGARSNGGYAVGMSVPTRLAAICLICLLATACGQNASTVRGAPSYAAANAVSMHAIGLVGTPYRYGGNSPAGGFDCSGLVGYVFRESADLALPRSTRELAELSARRIKPDQLRAGDLVLFANRGRVDHIGIYVGERRFVHAPSRGGTVRIDSIEGSYWKPRLHSALRLLP